MKHAMAEVDEMQINDIEDVLRNVGYGHFACAENNQPYVVPINFVYDGAFIYFYTTEGKKTKVIKANPLVCLQVEEVVDNGDWRSVVVMGEADQILDANEREQAIKLILALNPTLTPAISIRWVDNWIRENVEAVYRIKPSIMTGRKASNVRFQAAIANSGNTVTSPNH